MSRQIDTFPTPPTSHEPDRDEIGRARTLTPGELVRAARDGHGVEIRRTGFQLADLIGRRAVRSRSRSR